MWPSLLRSQKGRRSETTPLLAALQRYRSRHADDQTANDDDDDDAAYDEVAHYDGEDEDDDGHSGRRRSDGPLLPVFSELLDRIPIYSTTHVIRTLIVQKCETTLAWDQLRSPQVSQFLVKPIQQQILSQHFARGTLYCLIANALQFRKEADENPGNMGVSKTRALICELLAMRLLKEHSTRELIDALSYDFDPLQGMTTPTTAGTVTPGGPWARQTPRSARISTLEVAIRAQAKKFLAHPLVVQQLEAIWAGTIVFHSAADSLHRAPTLDVPRSQGNRYNTFDSELSPRRGPSNPTAAGKQPRPQPQSEHHSNVMMRRTVTLYDPHDASLFKLSRLRVPRYRNLFSTISFAVMLGLFLAVLSEKSDDITVLEVIFWFWSAGYMLDEIVGFSEQGFGLYIMSVWNAFDLGILLLFLVYYVLRLWGILISDPKERHHAAGMAYDVLGATAVLLFPRLFSALDHYRYFSQLLIAFRMMALDLVAILLLIIISCSGFFIAFALAFKKDFDAPNAAYALFQMLMGFTPAAWDLWDDFNPLGKTLLTLFLFICHFLIVTILITVLTNSFIAVVQNANEEHQFLFAVNTISMVKSDALFSYIPPTNVLGWLVIPLKYVMPFRRFIRMNRLIIKVTHIPVLFSIFLYERVLLSNLSYGPTDLVEQRGRAQSKVAGPAFSVRGANDLFSPGTRLREPSITTFRKDRALEEVFRRPFRDGSAQASASHVPRRNSSNVVTQWMKNMGNDDEAFPPLEDTQSVLDRAEARNRPQLRRTKTAGQAQQRRGHPLANARRVASDPDNDASPFQQPIVEEEEPDQEDLPQQTDADGDDELLTNDEEERESADRATKNDKAPEGKDGNSSRVHVDHDTSEDEYFRTPMATKPRTPAPASSRASSGEQSPSKKQNRWKPGHNRNLSTNTVLFSPKEDLSETSRSRSPVRRPQTRSGTATGTATPGRMPPDGRRTPKRPALGGAPPARPRAILPPRDLVGRQAQNIADLLAREQRRRSPSFNAVALDLASDLGDNRAPNFATFGGLPASFSTQLELAARTKAMHTSDEDSNRMSRIMLARMTTLEEGFRDVLKEVKGLRKGSEDGLASREGTAGTRSPPNEPSKKKGKGKKKAGKRDGGEVRMGSSV